MPLALILTACLLLTGACVLPPTPEATASSTIYCNTTQDCDQGEVCEVKVCVVETSVKEIVAIQLTPSNEDTVLTEQFTTVEIEQGQPLPDLQFQKPRLITGAVRVLSSNGVDEPAPINANLLLRRTSPEIPGSPLFFEVEASREAGYALRLPGGIYDITVLPSGDFIQEQVRDLPVSVDTQYNFTLGGLAETTEVSGRVVFTDFRSEQTETVSGAVVSAITSENATVSTTAVTDDNGFFTLNVRQNVVEIRLVLDPADRQPALPRVITENIRLTGQSISLGDLTLGTVLPLARRIRGSLKGELNDIPVANTPIFFSGEVGDGTLTQTTITDRNGNFTIDIPPSMTNYTARATPPATLPGSPAPHAITAWTDLQVAFDINEEVSFHDLRVRPKSTFSGRATSPDGAIGLNGASVQLTPVAGQIDARPYSVIADSEGRFELLIDPGIYDIVMIPPPTSGYARAIQRRVTLQALNNASLTLPASRPNLARGLVIDADNQPTPNILVEIFRLEEGQDAFLIGSGLTDEKGEYRIFVPALRTSN